MHNPQLLIITEKGKEDKALEYLKPYRRFITGDTHQICLHIPKAEFLYYKSNKDDQDWSDDYIIGSYLEFNICLQHDINYLEIVKVEKENFNFFITKFQPYIINKNYEIVINFNEYGFENGISKLANVNLNFYDEFKIRNIITPDGKFWNRNHVERPDGEILTLENAIASIGKKDILQNNYPQGEFDYYTNSTVPFFDQNIWEGNWNKLLDCFINIYKDHSAVLVAFHRNIQKPSPSHHTIIRSKKELNEINKRIYSDLFNGW